MPPRKRGALSRGPGLTVDLGTASLTLHLFPLLQRGNYSDLDDANELVEVLLTLDRGMQK